MERWVLLVGCVINREKIRDRGNTLETTLEISRKKSWVAVFLKLFQSCLGFSFEIIIWLFIIVQFFCVRFLPFYFDFVWIIMSLLLVIWFICWVMPIIFKLLFFLIILEKWWADSLVCLIKGGRKRWAHHLLIERIILYE